MKQSFSINPKYSLDIGEPLAWFHNNRSIYVCIDDVRIDDCLVLANQEEFDLLTDAARNQNTILDTSEDRGISYNFVYSIINKINEGVELSPSVIDEAKIAASRADDDQSTMSLRPQ